VKSVATPAGDEALSRLREGDGSFYKGNVEEGKRLLLDAWTYLKENPQSLPSEDAQRAGVYRSLLTLLRVFGKDEPGAFDELSHWLAIHMSDQTPSVVLLPPVLAAEASKAVEQASRAQVLVSSPAPESCMSAAVLHADGRAIAGLPASGQRLVAGDHSFHVSCDGAASWARARELSQDLTLEAPDMEIEPAVCISKDSLAVHPSVSNETRVMLATRMARWLDVDGVVLVPPRSNEGVEGLVIIESDVTPSPWPRILTWGSLAMSAGLAGCAAWAAERHNDEIDRMATGVIDTRDRASNWQDVSIGCLVGSGAMFAVFSTLLAIDVLDEPPPPLFPIN